MKKKRKFIFLLNVLASLVLIISLFNFSYCIFLYKGFETFYRIMAILICGYICAILISSLHFSRLKNKKKRNIISLITAIIFTAIFIVGAFVLKGIYNKLENMSNSESMYTTKLISLEKYDINNLIDKKIGIIDNVEDIEYYKLPKEVIEKYKLDKNNSIKEYSTNLELIDALYEKKVDLIFVSGTYIDIFSGFDEYEDIAEKVVEIHSYEKEYKEEISEEEEKEMSKLTEPFSILLLGIDSTTTKLAKNASFNGDTMILVTFNPKTMSATMLSFPRDVFVKVACNNKLQRINTSAWCGTNGAVKTVRNLTGLDIDYYVKINFKGLVNLVNALGGIDVDVPYTFCEQNSSRKWGDNTVYVKKGLQHLDGEQALALARNRHYPNDGSSAGKKMAKYCPNDKEGSRNDFTRNANQQLVIRGIIEAAKNIDSITKVNEILDTISSSIDTNMKTQTILSGYDLIKSVALNKNANMLNIQKTKLKIYTIGKGGHMIYEPSTKRYTSVAFYYKESLKDIVEAMKINLGLKKGTLIKEFTFDINEPYEQKVIGNDKYSETKYQLVPNFSSYSVSNIKSFASKNELTLKFINSVTNEEVDISSYTDYTFLSQNEHEHTPVFRINSLTIYVKPKNSAVVIPDVNNAENETSDNNTENNTGDNSENNTEDNSENSTDNNTGSEPENNNSSVDDSGVQP